MCEGQSTRWEERAEPSPSNIGDVLIEWKGDGATTQLLKVKEKYRKIRKLLNMEV